MFSDNSVKCYLCGCSQISSSGNHRKVSYHETIHSFYKCFKCGSYSLFPKLNDYMIESLYSSSYSDNPDIATSFIHDEYHLKFLELRHFLESVPENPELRYLDYGCGSTPLTLQIASKLGFLAEGVEFSDDVVEFANTHNIGNVMSLREFSRNNVKYDYIFLGDVIEHFVDPLAELRLFHSRMAEKGLLIAQGPLQGALTLSHLIVNIKSQLNRKKVSNFPPYHVSLATKKGMLQLMEASNFEIIQMKIFEKNWPAPNLYGLFQDFSIRGFFLLLVKQIDKALSRILGHYGSQYFLVAQKKLASSK